jgi:hypothetical protein
MSNVFIPNDPGAATLQTQHLFSKARRAMSISLLENFPPFLIDLF